MYTPIPENEIFAYDNGNPTISIKGAEYDLSFAQTYESLIDVEFYKRFLYNAITRFRKSRTYTDYKATLMQMGLNMCQVHSNITNSEESEMATIEMHHNILTIFDIAIILCESLIKKYGCITSFDLAEMLEYEHINHRVCLVMLSKTAHQMVHADPEFIIPPQMCFGNWVQFLQLYGDGITVEIAYKLIGYIDKVVSQGLLENQNQTLELLNIRKYVYDWSVYNEQGATSYNKDVPLGEI